MEKLRDAGLIGTITWPQVNSGTIKWPEIYALLFTENIVKSLQNYILVFLRIQNRLSRCLFGEMIRGFDLSSELLGIVPFSKYALWKHKVEKAATLWV